MTMLEYVEHRVEEHGLILNSAAAIFIRQQRLLVSIATVTTSLAAVVPFDTAGEHGQAILAALEDLQDTLDDMAKFGFAPFCPTEVDDPPPPLTD